MHGLKCTFCSMDSKENALSVAWTQQRKLSRLDKNYSKRGFLRSFCTTHNDKQSGEKESVLELGNLRVFSKLSSLALFSTFKVPIEHSTQTLCYFKLCSFFFSTLLHPPITFILNLRANRSK